MPTDSHTCAFDRCRQHTDGALCEDHLAKVIADLGEFIAGNIPIEDSHQIADELHLFRQHLRTIHPN